MGVSIYNRRLLRKLETRTPNFDRLTRKSKENRSPPLSPTGQIVPTTCESRIDSKQPIERRERVVQGVSLHPESAVTFTPAARICSLFSLLGMSLGMDYSMTAKEFEQFRTRI